jgi:hypothetical protein
MRKIFAVLAVMLTIGAVVPVAAQAADRNHGNQFYDAGAGGGGR